MRACKDGRYTGKCTDFSGGAQGYARAGIRIDVGAVQTGLTTVVCSMHSQIPFSKALQSAYRAFSAVAKASVASSATAIISLKDAMVAVCTVYLREEKEDNSWGKSYGFTPTGHNQRHNRITNSFIVSRALGRRSRSDVAAVRGVQGHHHHRSPTDGRVIIWTGRSVGCHSCFTMQIASNSIIPAVPRQSQRGSSQQRRGTLD